MGSRSEDFAHISRLQDIRQLITLSSSAPSSTSHESLMMAGIFTMNGRSASGHGCRRDPSRALAALRQKPASLLHRNARGPATADVP